MMPEILTESFCERCGTRYTFESVAPRKTRKLGQFKTLSKGVKNWVMSDDSSLDEAMAAARSDDEREQTAQQLDAFHSTFNFCMSCRQYTCSNCWNTADGRCLSCAPNLGQDVLGMPFPTADADGVRLDVQAWPEVDLAPADGTPDLETLLAGNGAHRVEPNGTAPGPDGVEPESTAAAEDVPEFDAFARLAFLTGESDRPAWPVEEGVGDAAALDGATDLIGLPEPVEEAAAGVVAGPAETPGPAPDAGLPEPVPPIAAETIAAAAFAAPAGATEPAPPPLPDDLEERTAALSDRTTELLGRFRPGQNIDAELAAYEAELDAKEVAGELEAITPPTPLERSNVPEIVAAAAVVAGVDAVAEAETPLVEAEPEDDAHRIAAAAALAAAAAAAKPTAERAHHVVEKPRTAAAEPAPVAAEPEPVAAEPEPVPAELAPVAAEPEPVAAEPESAGADTPVREDLIEQPTWRIYAPDGQDTGTPPSVVPGPTTPQPSVPIQASATPQWPSRPDLDESPSMALLANRARTGDDAMWAASAREVLGPASAASAAAPAGVQPCSNCGLSLSANARFCRRCGTRQG
jgi:nicotinate-nucleotide--dimethylbenzimidazole phosphoribosyltransferase